MAIEAIKNAIDGVYEYPDPADSEFRRALTDFYDGALEPDQFITGNSGVALLQMIVQAFLGEGLECIFSYPGFSPYKMFPLKIGANSINVPLMDPDFALDVEGILGAITEHTRLIWLSSPNNPTGSYISKTSMDSLMDQIPDDIIVVYDEVYFQYVDADDYVRGLPYVHAGKKVIAINSFSKAYGLAGLRVGYAYSSAEIARYVSQLRRPFQINSLSCKGAIAALKDEDHIKRTVENNTREKEWLYKELDQLPIKYWPTQANFILIDPARDPQEFEKAMQTQGIMVRPTGGFGSPNTIRVTIGTHEANVAYIRGLRQVLSK